MSLKIISKQSNEKTEDFWRRIETETGTTVEYDFNSNGTSFSIPKITFSDGNYVGGKGSDIVSDMDIGTKWVVLIDDSNHFFMLTYAYKMNQGGGGSLDGGVSSCSDLMIVDIDGTPHIVPSTYDWYYAFNIPYSAYNNHAAQTIKILPAYVYAYSRKGYSKNLYINYDRAFDTGLKFVDQNNNEFITLGCYLLYYNGKHK